MMIKGVETVSELEIGKLKSVIVKKNSMSSLESASKRTGSIFVL